MPLRTEIVLDEHNDSEGRYISVGLKDDTDSDSLCLIPVPSDQNSDEFLAQVAEVMLDAARKMEGSTEQEC